MKKTKWPAVVAAMIILALTWMDTDTLKTLSPEAILPVIVITAVVFLVKTGVLTAVLTAVKKLWEHFRK